MRFFKYTKGKYMIEVKMEKECGCFKRSDYESVKQFENRDEALLYAQEICADMNETFCQKHRFSVAENGDGGMTILVAMRD